jgi:hypothetical protein
VWVSPDRAGDTTSALGPNSEAIGDRPNPRQCGSNSHCADSRALHSLRFPVRAGRASPHAPKGPQGSRRGATSGSAPLRKNLQDHPRRRHQGRLIRKSRYPLPHAHVVLLLLSVMATARRRPTGPRASHGLALRPQGRPAHRRPRARPRRAPGPRRKGEPSPSRERSAKPVPRARARPEPASRPWHRRARGVGHAFGFLTRHPCS